LCDYLRGEIDVHAAEFDALSPAERAASLLAIENELKRKLDADVYRRTAQRGRESRGTPEESGLGRVRKGERRANIRDAGKPVDGEFPDGGPVREP
jgi:hypothetical protein